MSVRVEKIPGAAFLAFPDMQGLLTAELAERFGYGTVNQSATIGGSSFFADGARWYGDLLYCPDFSVSSPNLAQTAGTEAAEPYGADLGARGNAVPYWARTTLTEPFLLHFESIGEAAKALRDIQRNWAPYQFTCFRRASLIQDRLPHINLKARTFPVEIPHSPMGMYTLLGEHTLIAGGATTSALPAGTVQFVEDHENPPSRAYLKIQEALTMANHFFGVSLPGAGQKCFEAGACPGGWTWVLRQLGADVFAVDRAPLAQSLMEDEHVIFQAHDAFTLKPEEVCARMDCEQMDWVLSDVICYPARLYEWVNVWLESGRARNMICTIKMQGVVDWNLVARFASIPKSRVLHLNYNKHELTWLHVS